MASPIRCLSFLALLIAVPAAPAAAAPPAARPGPATAPAGLPLLRGGVPRAVPGTWFVSETKRETDGRREDVRRKTEVLAGADGDRLMREAVWDGKQFVPGDRTIPIGRGDRREFTDFALRPDAVEQG